MAIRKAGAALFVAASMLASTAGSAADEDYEIPLKLFGTEDVSGGVASCHLSIWQHNRDPRSDRYAILLHANQNADGSSQPAQLKIGKEFHVLDELVYGGEPISGYGSQYLFANSDRTFRAHLELLEVDFREGAFFFDRAKLTVIQKGKMPFTANAKGVSGCPQSAAVAKAEERPAPAAKKSAGLPAGIPFGAEILLQDASDVPYAVQNQMIDYASDVCDVGGYFPWNGAKYVVNDYYMLWQIPCFSGAYQGSSVVAVTQNPPGDWAELLSLPNPPGLEGNQNYAAMNAIFDGRKGQIKTTELNRGAGDCGVYQVFRLIDGPGEVIELELLEYRDKYDCDGNATDPASWPLAYRAN